jgi:hypothetical protein
MKTLRVLFLLVIISLVSFTTHKYYLSLTQIKFKQEAKAVQIIINVFMDDIETALNKDYNIDLQINTEKELKDSDVYFQKYLKEKLHFKLDNVSKAYNYIGKEYDGDLVYFYLEIENIATLKNIDITNNILTNHFPNQQNLIKSKVGNTHKSILLTKKEPHTILKY